MQGSGWKRQQAWWGKSEGLVVSAQCSWSVRQNDDQRVRVGFNHNLLAGVFGSTDSRRYGEGAVLLGVPMRYGGRKERQAVDRLLEGFDLLWEREQNVNLSVLLSTDPLARASFYKCFHVKLWCGLIWTFVIYLITRNTEYFLSWKWVILLLFFMPFAQYSMSY